MSFPYGEGRVYRHAQLHSQAMSLPAGPYVINSFYPGHSQPYLMDLPHYLRLDGV